MIIECVNCNKKFEVNSDLIPDSGRTIQCGSCNYLWFFNKNDLSNFETNKNEISLKKTPPIKKKNNIKNLSRKSKQSFGDLDKNFTKKDPKKSALVKYEKKSNFTFLNFLSYILVFIITFIAFVIIVDTFKSPLYNIFPKLEHIMFSLYETLKDIELFIKDLI